MCIKADEINNAEELVQNYITIKSFAYFSFRRRTKEGIFIMIPGEYILPSGNIECNVGRATVKISVANTGDRPIQVGSHFHFFEVNKQMKFDREKAFGMRLNIAAGTAVRFEPGEEKEVELVVFGGKRQVHGFNNLVDGDVSAEANKTSLDKLSSLNFKNTKA